MPKLWDFLQISGLDVPELQAYYGCTLEGVEEIPAENALLLHISCGVGRRAQTFKIIKQ